MLLVKRYLKYWNDNVFLVANYLGDHLKNKKPKLPCLPSPLDILPYECAVCYSIISSLPNHTHTHSWNLNLIKAPKPSEFNLSVTEKAETWGPWAKPYTPSDSGFARPAKPLIVSALASKATTTSKSNVIFFYDLTASKISSHFFHFHYFLSL